MKTLLSTRNAAVMFDPETVTLEPKGSDRESIQKVLLIDEPCDVKTYYYIEGELKEVTMHADAGDILVTFWADDFVHKSILVKSDEWAENIRTYREQEQKAKLEWAAKHAGDNKANTRDMQSNNQAPIGESL